MGGQQLSLVFPILLIAIFYFLLIRPQKKREKSINEMRSKLKVGDKVVTIGGIHGKIIKIKDDIITLEIGADKVRLTFSRWAISTLDEGSQPTTKENKNTSKEKSKEIPQTDEETASKPSKEEDSDTESKE